MISIPKTKAPHGPIDRRRFVGTAVGAWDPSPFASSPAESQTGTGALTKDARDRMTPDQVIAEMKKGNERFRTGKMMPHDYVAQQQSSAAGQYPAAVVLGCIDSRAPGEILFDQGIGEAFNARIAGNVVKTICSGAWSSAARSPAPRRSSSSGIRRAAP